MAERRKACHDNAIVRKKLKQWVAGKKYRLRYYSMDSILDELGLTSKELSSYCSRKFKKNFLSWRKDLRMDDAKRMLLEHPDFPVTRIAEEVGIDDKSNFRHQFKSVTGYTPTEWRLKKIKK